MDEERKYGGTERIKQQFGWEKSKMSYVPVFA